MKAEQMRQILPKQTYLAFVGVKEKNRSLPISLLLCSVLPCKVIKIRVCVISSLKIKAFKGFWLLRHQEAILGVVPLEGEEMIHVDHIFPVPS